MKMFQISEQDLASLEVELPVMADAACMVPDASPRVKKAVRLAKRIMSDVRWNYMPPTEVEEIPAESE